MKIGFKESLIVSMLILVSISLCIVSFVTYSNVSLAFKKDKTK